MTNRKRVFRSCVVAFAFAFSLGAAALPDQAEAASRNVVIPIFATNAQGSALVSPTNILLNPTGESSVYINFVLPADYEKGKKIDMNIYLGSQGAPCTAVIKKKSLIRFREDEPFFNGLGGFVAADGLDTVSMPGNNYVVINKKFKLKKTDGFPGQKPRDIFSISFKRDADDPADTCDGYVSFLGLSFDYPIANPK